MVKNFHKLKKLRNNKLKSDKEIEKIRDNIDDIDQKIIKLIEKRVIQAIKISRK